MEEILDRDSGGIRADLKLLNETMKLGLADVNRRFAMMFTFITIGLTVLGLAIVFARQSMPTGQPPH